METATYEKTRALLPTCMGVCKPSACECLIQATSVQVYCLQNCVFKQSGALKSILSQELVQKYNLSVYVSTADQLKVKDQHCGSKQHQKHQIKLIL